MLKGQAGPLLLVFLAACFRLCASLQAPGQPLGALLRRDNLSAQALLQHHNSTESLRAAAIAATGQPLRPAPVLAFVTPWNSRGYDLAKQHRCRLMYVVPVWYQLRSVGGVLQLNGAHDVDVGWMSAVRQPCVAADGQKHVVRVLPRVLFEVHGQDVQEAFSQPHAVAKLLATEAERHGFDGWVFEGWSHFVSLGVTKHPGSRQLALNLLQSIFSGLVSHGRRLVLAVSPLVPAPGRPLQLTAQDVQDFLPFVDALTVMTYDFSGFSKAGPNAPLDWVQQNADAFAAAAGRLRSKVLLGVPFYGYSYVLKGKRVQSADAVLAGTLLDVLKQQLAVAAAQEAAARGSEEEQAQRQCSEEQEEDSEGDEAEGGRAGSCAASPASSGSSSSSSLRISWLDVEREHVFRWRDAAGSGGTQQQAKPSKGAKHALYFPTPVMLAERLAVAASHGMGVSVWELGQGFDSFCSLL
ncbi:hypothetical protein D9Q98_009137 [Chlorella vulgaris]|uniref:Chitinase domain-containing protein 1 n=1 Tax=Chlorella vulgaris TaxID=3077 RepID=A0A9D4THE5_CHLVU|nr:hypothetical protein D9Q98_009137 [Chlorella vulgaris]